MIGPREQTPAGRDGDGDGGHDHDDNNGHHHHGTGGARGTLEQTNSKTLRDDQVS
jgi:hypothetical protein